VDVMLVRGEPDITEVHSEIIVTEPVAAATS
jgi:hypothetical protein